MYELFASKESASDIIEVLLEEIGAKYSIRNINLADGDQQTPEFLAINPTGRVPVLIDDGLVVFETAAIIFYLLEKHPGSALAPGPGTPERAAFLQWLMYMSNTLQTAYSRMYYPERFTSRQDQADGVRTQVDLDLAKIWQIVDDRLAASGPYMLGEQFSALDIYVLVMVTWHQPMDMIAEHFPNVQGCFDLVCERPSVVKAMAGII
ncbi:MAG: glutathione S-transferase family protein [Rhodospirillaceae bacterium]|nr:glutathione S-transferase family protein [Rhodospirillaceae bacterium]